MSDLKLFRLSPAGITEIPGQSVAVEKSLQTLFETNLEALLGVRFLATEYVTGKVHGGRIDTLGIGKAAVTTTNLKKGPLPATTSVW